MNSRTTKPGPKEIPIGILLFWEHEWYRTFHGLAFGVSATDYEYTNSIPELPPKGTGIPELDRERRKDWDCAREGAKWKQITRRIKTKGIPAERQVWEQFKNARFAAQVRAACDASTFWLNFKENGRPYTAELRRKAKQFLAASRYRYPRSNRASSERKRVLHVARAMAGIMELRTGRKLKERSAITAIDRIRRLPHGKQCGCVACEIDRYETFQKRLYAVEHSQ